MDLNESFRRECMQIGMPDAGKDEILRRITRLARKSDLLEACSEEELYRALRAREKVGSTAFGGGVAIPHCAMESIDAFVVGLITAPEGVDFGSADGEPTRLIIFIVGPNEKRNEHVSLLSAISRVLDDESAVEEMLSARDPDALADSFLRRHAGRISHRTREQCLFHVVVQDEGVFNDVLKVFSGAVEGDISVIEAQNASTYLDRLPMFAAFWNEQSGGFCRVILAVVDKSLCNEVVRRINLAVNDLEKQSGVLLTVHELMLTRGRLDF